MAATLILDFDSTIVQTETLDELALICLHDHPQAHAIQQSIHELTQQAMNGELDFETALQQRISLLPLHRQHIDACIDILRNKISASFLRERDFFSQEADRIYVVSGGFNEIIIPVIEILGLHANHVYANEFCYDNKGTVTGVNSSLLLSKAQGKVKQLKALALEAPIIMIGDGFTDYEVKKEGVADLFCLYSEHIERANLLSFADVNLRDIEKIKYL